MTVRSENDFDYRLNKFSIKKNEKFHSNVFLVARTGFEPVIFALRGRCPKPLDERAVFNPSIPTLEYKLLITFNQYPGSTKKAPILDMKK